MQDYFFSLPFGQHRDEPLYTLPDSYLRWLLDPILRNGERYHVTPKIQEAARYWLAARRDGHARHGGAPGSTILFLLTLEGDLPDRIPGPLAFATRDEAFALIERLEPDPEDDRILLWEVLPSGHRKVIWHCSGWHWAEDAWDSLDQGHLPGHNTSLYHEIMKDL